MTGLGGNFFFQGKDGHEGHHLNPFIPSPSNTGNCLNVIIISEVGEGIATHPLDKIMTSN